MLVANPFRRVKQIISIQERVYIEIFDCLLQTGPRIKNQTRKFQWNGS